MADWGWRDWRHRRRRSPQKNRGILQGQGMMRILNVVRMTWHFTTTTWQAQGISQGDDENTNVGNIQQGILQGRGTTGIWNGNSNRKAGGLVNELKLHLCTQNLSSIIIFNYYNIIILLSILVNLTLSHVITVYVSSSSFILAISCVHVSLLLYYVESSHSSILSSLLLTYPLSSLSWLLYCQVIPRKYHWCTPQIDCCRMKSCPTSVSSSSLLEISLAVIILIFV